MMKKLLAIILSILTVFSLCVPAEALSLEYFMDEASFVYEVRLAESLVEAEVLSKELHKFSGGGPRIYNGDSRPLHDISFNVTKNLSGKKISLGKILLTTNTESIQVGETIILGLVALSMQEREEFKKNSPYDDPGPYYIRCELRRNEDGSVTVIHLPDNKWNFSSFGDLMWKVDGKAVIDPSNDYMPPDTHDALFYNGMKICTAEVTKRATLYSKRSTKSAKVMTLEASEHVLRLGKTDIFPYVDQSGRGYDTWQKVLLSDGKIGYLPEGSLKDIFESADLKEAKLAAVTSTQQLRNLDGDLILSSKIRQGTATIVLESSYQPYFSEGVSYDALRAGSVAISLAPTGSVKVWDALPKNAKIEVRTVDIEEVDDYVYSFKLDSGSYRVRGAAKTATVYARPSKNAKPLLKIGKGDTIAQSGTPMKKNGSTWVTIVMKDGEPGYVLADTMLKDRNIKRAESLENGFGTTYVRKDGEPGFVLADTLLKDHYVNSAESFLNVVKTTYLYTLQDGMIQTDKTKTLRSGTMAIVEDYIRVDDAFYIKLKAYDGNTYYAPWSKLN